MTNKLNRRKSSAAAGRIDPWLLTATLLLGGFGLVMVLSSSGIMAERVFSDKYFFFKRQLYLQVSVWPGCLPACRSPAGCFTA